MLKSCLKLKSGSWLPFGKRWSYNGLATLSLQKCKNDKPFCQSFRNSKKKASQKGVNYEIVFKSLKIHFKITKFQQNGTKGILFHPFTIGIVKAVYVAIFRCSFEDRIWLCGIPMIIKLLRRGSLDLFPIWE